MKVIEMLYEFALDQSEYILPREIFYNALFFNTASAMGLQNLRILRKTNRGDKLIIPNYFGITFSGSGTGKDHSNNIAKSMFRGMFEKLESRSEAFYDSRRQSDGKGDPKYINMTSYFPPVSSSWQGIQKVSQTLSDMGSGSVNVVADELADSITGMTDMFAMMKTAWDTGTSVGPVNVSNGGEGYFTVNDICFNALLFGAPAPFELDQKKKDKLLEAYVSGMARRSFIYHNDTYKKSENRNPNFETMPMEKVKEIDDYLKELRYFINNTETILFPQEVRKKLVEYDIEKESSREKSHSLIAEDLGSPKKIEKLLGILATLDLSPEITDEHLEFAINFVQMTDETAEETVELKPIYLQIYKEMEKRNFTARTDIVKAIKDVTLKSLEDEMVLVEEHASMVGNSLIKKEYDGITRYKLEKLSETSLEKVLISVNPNMNRGEPQGFIKKEAPFEKIHTVVNGAFRYSAGTFRTEYINDDNYMQEQNLFIIDVDEDMTLEEAKNLFSDMTYLIATTKSHQKPKHDVICDRFRIILPTVSKFHLEPSVYSETYINVLNSLGIPEADTKCRNASRWYFGNDNEDAEHWYNKGKLLDIRAFIPDSAEKHTADIAVNNYDEDKEHAPTDIRIDGALRWFLSKTSKGNRNDNLFLLCMLLKDPNRINTPDWQHWAVHANGCLADPLSDRDVQTILNSANRR